MKWYVLKVEHKLLVGINELNNIEELAFDI